MICPVCRESGFRTSEVLIAHQREIGCTYNRSVWERYVRAKQRGSSGKRILRRAFPHLFKAKPMPEELKERWKRAK